MSSSLHKPIRLKNARVLRGGASGNDHEYIDSEVEIFPKGDGIILRFEINAQRGKSRILVSIPVDHFGDIQKAITDILVHRTSE